VSSADLVDLGLISNIYEIWEASGRTYGADRVHRQLRRDGIRVGRKRVERLIRQQGWHGAFLRRGWRGGSTKQDPRHTPAPDLVNRNFSAAGPNRLWVADATRIPCGEGAFWLAAVRDVFSRRIVGWKTSDRCDTDLILAALEYGIWSRDVRDGQLVHHSDRGSNYTSFRFSQRLQDHGIRPSMGSVGDSYDKDVVSYCTSLHVFDGFAVAEWAALAGDQAGTAGGGDLEILPACMSCTTIRPPRA
jgi:transposase InsO family protein